jgi:hypothetical protein
MIPVKTPEIERIMSALEVLTEHLSHELLKQHDSVKVTLDIEAPSVVTRETTTFTRGAQRL